MTFETIFEKIIETGSKIIKKLKKGEQMTQAEVNQQEKCTLTVSDYRADIQHYWTRLMWYRDELWRVTTPILTAYGTFIVAMFGYLFTIESNIGTPKIINMLILVLGVTFVLIRLYFIYSTRIYAAIKYLNHEIEIREEKRLMYGGKGIRPTRESNCIAGSAV